MLRKSSRHSDKTVPLLAYWTRMYVLVLLLSLFLLAGISGVWIGVNTYNHRYDLLEMRAVQIAEKYEQMLEAGIPPEHLQQVTAVRAGGFPGPVLFQVADRNGRIYTIMGLKNPAPASQALYELSDLHGQVLSGRTIREKVGIDSQIWLRVGVPVYHKGVAGMALYASSPTRGILEQVYRLYGLLALITGIIGLSGWIVLYFLFRKLTRPLLQAAAAAQSISQGKYDVVLPQKLKERELKQLVESFKNMAIQLQKLEQLRAGLLAGVSHELRTPITSIRGMIQAVHGKVVTGADAEEFLKISLGEAKRLQGMVEELLDFTSLESGVAPIGHEEVDLTRLIEEVSQQMLILPEFKGVRIDRLLPVGHVKIRGDSGRLRQIILNLIDNSRKALAGEISIILKPDKELITLDVKDNGKGIPREDQPYIFERFYRGGDGKIKNRGLGLGLTISRLLARAHGGDLALLETSPEGTIFRLCLPAHSTKDA
ncbi:MAG: sensor histidine kinase [Bacillota bacterium]